MAENSGIEWTQHTWNPWQGCRKMSAGCLNCYMFRDKKRYGQDPTDVHRSSKATFDMPLRVRKPGVFFVCSWSDFFIHDADDWRDDAWDIMRRCPQHVFQILTKRVGNMHGRLPHDWGRGWPNVWLGVTVENNEAIPRVWDLVTIPAAVHFVSHEPALEPLDWLQVFQDGKNQRRCIDWVIAGCESAGGKRPGRPTSIDTLRAARNFCSYYKVPFFLKQREVDGQVVKMPELDGTVWAQMPEVVTVRHTKSGAMQTLML